MLFDNIISELITENFNDHHDGKPDQDSKKLNNSRNILQSFSVENLKHDDVEDGSAGDTLQGGYGDLGNPSTDPGLRDEDANSRANRAHQTERGQVGEECKFICSRLLQFHADAEHDDKLVDSYC